MKNLFTLFLISLTAFSFAQQQQVTTAVPKSHVAKRFPADSRFHAPKVNRPAHPGGARNSESCDTTDVLDYNTYAEMVAVNAGLTYVGSLNGSTPQPYVQEATSSFINIQNADNLIYSYVMAAFDTLVFPNYNTFSTTNDLQASYYTKTLKTSTVTLDSVEVVMSITGDTVSADGTMTNDSLVFQIYKTVGGIVTSPAVQRISYIGYSGLQPFLTGASHITSAVIPVGYTFAQGEGFAIRADYYNADTSSHCFFAFGQADSCSDLTYMGQSLGFSFAYPSPFIGTAAYENPADVADGLEVGNTFWGEIDSVATDSAAVRAICNGFGYFAITSFPTNCAYVFTQNWQFFPFVTVNNTLGITINGSNPLALACPSVEQTIKATKTGDLGGATYAWSTGQTSSTINFFNPGTFSVTVTNSSGCTASDQLSAAYPNGADVIPTFNAPDSICRGQVAAFVNTTNLSNYTATWIYGQGADSLQTTSNSTYTYTAPGNYQVTLILDSLGCEFKTDQTVTVNSFCVGIQNVTFDNNISIMPNPSNGNVNIIINGVDDNVNITVYNIIGQAVKSYASTDVVSVFNKNMDLSNLSNGTYLVKIQSGSKIATKKLVIAK